MVDPSFGLVLPEAWNLEPHLGTTPMPPRQAPAKNWCFTLNNYTDDEYQRVLSSDGVHYLIVGKEVGEGGTPHLQGYVQLDGKKRMAQVKAILGIERVHLEKARGTPQEASDYCKKDNQYEEVGEISTAGRKRDRDEVATEFRTLVSASGSHGICEFEEKNPGVFGFSGHNLLKNYQATIVPVLRPDISVTWVYGDPGIGKSRWAHEKYPEAYIKDPKTKWWHGYLGETQVIIDDFGKEGIDINHFLRWFDRYRCSVETKGGQMGLRATTFVVTSNFKPEDIFIFHAQLPALMRRITLATIVDGELVEVDEI